MMRLPSAIIFPQSEALFPPPTFPLQLFHRAMFGRTHSPSLLNLRAGPLISSVPRIMGVINATPDSFFGWKPGRHRRNKLRKRPCTWWQMALTSSTSAAKAPDPGPKRGGIQTECDRVLPVHRGSPLSAARPPHQCGYLPRQSRPARALDAGADLVNDIGAGVLDPAHGRPRGRAQRALHSDAHARQARHHAKRVHPTRMSRKKCWHS